MPLLYKTVTGSAGAALGLLFLSTSSLADSAFNANVKSLEYGYLPLLDPSQRHPGAHGLSRGMVVSQDTSGGKLSTPDLDFQSIRSCYRPLSVPSWASSILGPARRSTPLLEVRYMSSSELWTCR
jgi:hypothetical protein